MIKRNLPLMITLGVFVLGYLYCLTQFPGFASTRVICNILTDNAFLGIIAVGMTFVILSGGIGNIIDRLRLGYVVDMLHFQFWPSYPTFNVADVCIVSGAILGAIYYVLLYEKHDRRKTDGASDPANGQ